VLFEPSVMAVFVGSGVSWLLGVSVGLIVVALLILYFRSPKTNSSPSDER
jgi:hypothetical protein